MPTTSASASLTLAAIAAVAAVSLPASAASPHVPAASAAARLPLDLRAALLRTLAEDAATRCALPSGCVRGDVASLGTPDWLEQIVAGDDLVDNSVFGTSVAIDGDTALIGAIEKDPLGDAVGAGAVYVFERQAGAWTQTQKLVAADGALGDEFGASVALQGDTALVGAQKAPIGANPTQGAVYVFRPVAGRWTQTQKLTPAQAPADRMFGAWIALDGADALVSTPCGMLGDAAATCPVYALHQSEGSWAIAQEIEAGDYAWGDVFGYQTALRGGTALIGALGATIEGEVLQGAAYVYTNVDGVWTQEQKLVADEAGMAAFGWAVALGDGVALIGAPYATIGGNVQQGAAYVFERADGRWSQRQKLTSPATQVEDRFGIVVAWLGARAVVGTPWITDFEGTRTSGAIWLYAQSGADGYVEERVLLPSDIENFPTFAYSIAASGDTLLTGEPIDGLASRGQAAFLTHSPDRVFADGFEARP